MNDYQPIIVLGAARSGTKFVRDVLGVSEYSHVVPYDVTFIWRRGNRNAPDDALAPALCTEAIARDIRKALERCVVPATKGPPHWLIEKTVGNTVRVHFVHRVYPNALFINLIRDGRDVVESSYRMWHSPNDYRYLFAKMLKCFQLSDVSYLVRRAATTAASAITGKRKMSVWGVLYPNIQQDLVSLSIPEICAHQWLESVRRTRKDLVDIPPAQQITVHYEALAQDPAEVRRLAEFVGMPDKETVISAFSQRLHVSKLCQWKDRFDDSIWSKVMAIIEDELRALGYHCD